MLKLVPFQIVLFFSLYTMLGKSLNAQTAAAYFVTTWKTDNPGTSNSTSITIPCTGAGYNYNVDVNNDGTFEYFGQTGSLTHNYGIAGTYTVQITGTFPRIYFNNGGDRRKILDIKQWGGISWTSFANAFYGCSNLGYSATGNPDLSGVTSLQRIFSGCSAFNGDISGWNTSNITGMSGAFEGATSFNQNIGSWDVSNVTVMNSIFSGATSFNQNINS